MKLAMRLPGQNSSAAVDTDPRDEETTEIIDLASRTSYPAVANRKGKSDALGLAAGIGFVALIGAAALWGLSSGNVSEEGGVAAAGNATDAPPPPASILPVGTSPTDGLPSANAGGGIPLADPAPAPVLARAPGTNVAAGPSNNPYASPSLVYDGGVAPSAAAANAAAAEAAAVTTPLGAVVPGGGPAGDFAARIGGVGGGPVSARQVFDPATTVTEGTMIPAILETAINTDVPGFVRAVVSQDVRSHDGSRVLIPRSSRLVGQYQSGLQAGQRRAYVIWQSAILPDGVTVQLQSPATSFDGTAGVEGDVNNHFFGRFGSAILLSVIGGLANAASGGVGLVVGGGQSAASTALEQDGQRPPTIRVRMGEPIRVYTARSLDFGQVVQAR